MDHIANSFRDESPNDRDRQTSIAVIRSEGFAMSLAKLKSNIAQVVVLRTDNFFILLESPGKNIESETLNFTKGQESEFDGSSISLDETVRVCDNLKAWAFSALSDNFWAKLVAFAGRFLKPEQLAETPPNRLPYSYDELKALKLSGNSTTLQAVQREMQAENQRAWKSLMVQRPCLLRAIAAAIPNGRQKAPNDGFAEATENIPEQYRDSTKTPIGPLVGTGAAMGKAVTGRNRKRDLLSKHKSRKVFVRQTDTTEFEVYFRSHSDFQKALEGNQRQP